MYQVPNPIIHTPHPITGVVYTDINPQKTKKGQKVRKEVGTLHTRYTTTGVLLHMCSIAVSMPEDAYTVLLLHISFSNNVRNWVLLQHPLNSYAERVTI